LAVVIGPLLAGAEAQARLQDTDLFAPGGEGLLLIPLLRQLLCIFYYQFQPSCGELGQIGVDAGGSKLLVLNLKRPFPVKVLRGHFRYVAVTTCWCEFELQVVKLKFLPWSQVHVYWEVNSKKVYPSRANHLAFTPSDGGWRFHEKPFEVTELHILVADIANSDDERDRFAVAIGPLLAGAEAQARLQAVDLLAPCGESFFLLVRFLF